MRLVHRHDFYAFRSDKTRRVPAVATAYRALYMGEKSKQSSEIFLASGIAAPRRAGSFAKSNNKVQERRHA
jgi:hypothetical protein